MTEYQEAPVYIPPDRMRVWRFHPIVWILLPLVALVCQFYARRFVHFLSYLELPLLVTVYFALMRRQPLAGAMTGCLIGLAEDSLTQGYLGMYGIANTVIGYMAASISLRFDSENHGLRFLVVFGFFAAHQCLFWLLAHTLLGSADRLPVPQTIIAAFLNAVIALPLFHLFDKLKSEAQ